MRIPEVQSDFPSLDLGLGALVLVAAVAVFVKMIMIIQKVHGGEFVCVLLCCG